MAFKNRISLTVLFSLLSVFSLLLTPSQTASKAVVVPGGDGGGQWALLQKSIGISAMHMQLLRNNKVVIFDRTDFGESNLSLPAGKPCRRNDAVVKLDCTAHSVLYDVASNTYRPLTVQTDVWCSSGAVQPDGTLVQTGGYNSGDRKIRLFTPSAAPTTHHAAADGGGDDSDWVELPAEMKVRRWYATNHILPDGRIIVVGGRKQFNYEFFPPNPNNPPEVFYFPFLNSTNDRFEENNLYPFLHLLPDGTIFVFANRKSISFDYAKNRVVREFPDIPCEKRNYPSTGSSVLLPLRGRAAEVMVCGGAPNFAYYKSVKLRVFVEGSNTCGRLRVTDSDPEWVMERMPMSRVMSDMVLLPSGDVLIVNGASNGTAGWEDAAEPVLSPVIYYPTRPDPSTRFRVMSPSAIPRLYHSSAALLPDGRVLVGGSNPHVKYNFTAVYPTELSLEAFSPPYLSPRYSYLRPTIVSVEAMDNSISYGQKFAIKFVVASPPLDGDQITVALIAPSFVTHSFAMNQRLVYLDVVDRVQQVTEFGYKVNVVAPPTKNVAPPGYYMLFVVHGGIPGQCVWIKIDN